LRPIGIATLKRSTQAPEIPTFDEQGLRGFEVTSWTGIMAPAKTPEPIIRRLYAEIAKIVATQDFRNFLAAQGAEPFLMDPAEFAAYLRTDTARWAKVVKAAKIKID
jgi:tripartite-type tricarboxylate transporter receptor subunit TctC